METMATSGCADSLAATEYRELALLETLRSLLDRVLRGADGSGGPPLPEVCEQVGLTAQKMRELCIQLGRLGNAVESPQRRRLLREISRQRTVSQTLLRQWRRQLALRRVLLDHYTGDTAFGASSGVRGAE